MLSISGLKVDIAGSRVLSGIDLAVEPGELVALIGRNGAGKSTTFRSILGYRRPVAGTIRFKGEDLVGRAPHEIARMGIGFSPEESEVFADLTVEENIALPTWTRRSRLSSAERVERSLTVFPKLRQYLHRGGAQLSGGERKMVSVARALALDPSLLLLDEPFEGLSPAIIPVISEGIASIRSMGEAVLMAESNVHHLPDYVDRLYVIERGEMIFAGTLAEAKRDKPVMRVIAGEIELEHA
jgi:branched-chain amino acid transport system ATP-binding protein